jgi:hypothetical protein
MKDWILILFFIVVMVVGGILEHNYIVNSFETLGQKTTALEQLIDANATDLNVEAVTSEFDKLDAHWRKNEKRLCLFLNHEALEEVNQELSKMKVNIEFNYIREVKNSIALIHNIVSEYRDYAVISIESVL